MAAREQILVIRLSALGDLVQATGPMKAIRAHHSGAHLVLLTTAPYAALMRACPFIDEVWEGGRPKWSDLPAVLGLIARLRRAQFSRVYDLQTQGRTATYFRLLGPFPPAWSGHARGASLRFAPKPGTLHVQDLQRAQLKAAGIADVPKADLRWLHGDLSGFALPERFSLLVPGGSPGRPEKRWFADGYAALAQVLAARGLPPVVLGAGREEEAIAAQIAAAAPGAVSLAGRTSLAQIADLGRRAALAVGNDTGPMQILAAVGAPCAVLFGADSDPALSAPRPGAEGGHVTVVRRSSLDELDVDEVVAALPEPR